MAGNQNSGGANGGPQYNPANVNGRGGNGQSGRASGFKYGMNKTINDQRQMGNAAVSSVQSNQPSVAQPMSPELPPVTSITAKTAFPDQSIMHGAPIGDGANSIPGLPNQMEGQYASARNVIQQMADAPDASPMMKYLATRVGQKF